MNQRIEKHMSIKVEQLSQGEVQILVQEKLASNEKSNSTFNSIGTPCSDSLGIPSICGKLWSSPQPIIPY